MSHQPFTPKPPNRKPAKERRAANTRAGSLRWLKGLLGRPLGVERRGEQWQVVLVERRRNGPGDTPELAALRRELQERLLAHEHEAAAHAMRHLVIVHDALGREGWASVEGLSSGLLGKALLQVQMLLSQEPSAALADLADRLRAFHVAAELREEREARPVVQEPIDEVEISETSHDDFENAERGWTPTVPQVLTPSER